VQRIVREALAEVIEPIVYDEAIQLIRQHQAEGRKIYLVSASPMEIVRPLAEFLGVDDAIATTARLDEQGRYSGELEFYSYGPFKVDAMRELAEREGLDLAASYAYSDSATDIPMLEAVGRPVAVNPDRALLRVARQREWEVRWFVRPVRLRDRVTMPSPRQTAVGGGVVATAAAAVVVWWWLRREPPPPPPTRRQRVTAVLRRRGPSWRRPLRG
jgi:phosphoserine phosphatase